MPLATRISLDRATGTMLAEYTQPDDEINTILKWNREYAAARGDSKMRSPETFRLAARIPETVYYIWRKLYGFDLMKFRQSDSKKLMQILNSSEWQKLRTGFGRL